MDKDEIRGIAKSLDEDLEHAMALRSDPERQEARSRAVEVALCVLLHELSK